MTTPIPPSGLIQQWTSLANEEDGTEVWTRFANWAAQWGADQELEACRQWLEVNGAPRQFIDGLLTARRPTPMTLKQQSLALIDRIQGNTDCWDISELDVVRRALETLDD